MRVSVKTTLSLFGLWEHCHCLVCGMGTYRFRYLGISMHHKKINNKGRKKVENMLQKKLSSWKGKHLSHGGRLVLIIKFIFNNLAGVYVILL
jgi:hypothetical protein